MVVNADTCVPMDDGVVGNTPLVTLLTIAAWTVLFWWVLILDFVKCVFIGHVAAGACFVIVSAALSYVLGFPIVNSGYLLAYAALSAPGVGR
jgi:hypothetical protein